MAVQEQVPVPSVEPLPVNRFSHVEFWVGNAKQAAYYYRKAMGFDIVAYAGPETGIRDRASYVARQGDIQFVLSTPMHPDDEINQHLVQHGDGVRDISFKVDDVDAVFQLALDRGAVAVHQPGWREDGNGKMRFASIKTYGDTIHTFYNVKNYSGPFLPGFQEENEEGDNAKLRVIDHIVGNVEDGKMLQWEEYYKSIFGFKRFVSFDDQDISTEFSALRSVVVANDSLRVKMPINEPAAGKKKSQIQEYIDFYYGPGVQHIALLTGDIISAVDILTRNGVEFLQIPDEYYDTLSERVGKIDEDIEMLRKLQILVDRDEDGYLLQLFTKPVQDRPTLFFEVIQRKGAQSFGKGNFKALFESIERDQARRGNL